MRRAGSGYGDGLLAFPAGHVDRGETPTQCVVREAAEEIGVRIAADALKADGVMFRQSQEPRVDFFFAADRWSGEPTIREPHKCTELVWADPKNLPGDVLDFVGRAMALTGRYDEFGWDG